MAVPIQNITLVRGDTFSKVLRWEAEPFISKAITAITKAAPPVITAASHGLVTGWRVAIVGAGGMTEINALATDLRKLRAADFHQVTVLTANTVELNRVNASEYTTYTNGGYLVYRTPVSLAGYTARLMIKESYDDAAADAIVSLTSSSGITIDDTTKTITYTISAATTAALTISSGVYDLEMISGSGVVTKIVRGTVTVDDEVTT